MKLTNGHRAVFKMPWFSNKEPLGNYPKDGEMITIRASVKNIHGKTLYIVDEYPVDKEDNIQAFDYKCFNPIKFGDEIAYRLEKGIN